MEKEEVEEDEENGEEDFRCPCPSGPAGGRHREQRTSSTLPVKIGTKVQPHVAVPVRLEQIPRPLHPPSGPTCKHHVVVLRHGLRKPIALHEGVFAQLHRLLQLRQWQVVAPGKASGLPQLPRLTNIYEKHSRLLQGGAQLVEGDAYWIFHARLPASGSVLLQDVVGLINPVWSQPNHDSRSCVRQWESSRPTN